MAADLLEQTRRERDFYLRLLALDAQSEPEPFLKEALSLVVELTGAERGYLELRDEHDDTADAWSAENCSEEQVSSIRSQISRGIVAAALATGETVVTESALFDDRFKLRESVQRAQIQGVLCAPIGGRAALGVVYLQKRVEPGSFSEADRRNAEIFASHLAPIAERVFLRRRMAAQNDAMRDIRARYRVQGIVGRAPALAEALRQAMLAAPLDVNVLLTGASGTGKTQLARAIHANSRRAAGPFVEINCGAIPTTLVENELFGSKQGAYTGADRNQPGKVGAAAHGTLFLDEIADLPFEAQSKLLQLLQSRAYWPLGATAPVTADVRLIAATNTDLEQAVRERRFREDLYFRLQVLPVRMPTLRERQADIAELATALLATVRERHRLPQLELSPGALRALESSEWPGNVRQLENAIEAAAIRAAGQGSARIEAHHAFPDRHAASEIEPDTRALSFQEQTRRFQRTVLQRALEESDWNVTETARRLDLARSHVYNLIQAFGLKKQ